MLAARGCSSHLDSGVSSQSYEPPECSSRRRQAPDAQGAPSAAAPVVIYASKRRRIDGEACVRVLEDSQEAEGTVLGGIGDDALGSTSFDGCTGSLCCAETAEASLEDCSSLEPEEGFVVYQSPLSLGAEEQGQVKEGGAQRLGGSAGAAAAMPPDVLADRQALLQPQPPVCDPDLKEMLSVLFDVEMELRPGVRYMEQHGAAVLPDLYLDASMRRTAASWLVEVAAEFCLHQETLFLATALLDRFLTAAKGVPRTQLQLVAVACMLIAAKHEEEMHPSVLDFTNIADNCFLPGDLLRMEAIILDVLSFRINTPTAHTFLSMYKQALTLQPRTCALASYLSELGMLEYELLHCRPSHLAAAAALVAKIYTNDMNPAGISLMPSVTNYSMDDLKPCMRRLLALQRAAHTATDYSSPYLAVRDKYRSQQWFCVGSTTPFTRLPTAMLGLVAPTGGAATVLPATAEPTTAQGGKKQ